MLSKFFKKKPDRSNQPVYLASDSYFIKVSNEYEVEKDADEGTILIYPKGEETITLRIDTLSYTAKDENSQIITGYDYILLKEKGDNQSIYFEDNLAVAFHEISTQENGTPLEMKFWRIGTQDSLMVFLSATVLKEKKNSREVKNLLSEIPDIIRSLKKTSSEHSIQTPSGTLNYHMNKVPSIGMSVQNLASDDRKFIETWFINGYNIIRYYLPEINLEDVSYKILDSTFEEWLRDRNQERFNQDSIANGLGVVFGNMLSKELEMVWAKVNDEFGEDYCIRSIENYTAYPISSVYKRIESQDTGFFMNIYEMIKHMINNGID